MAQLFAGLKDFVSFCITKSFKILFSHFPYVQLRYFSVVAQKSNFGQMLFPLYETSGSKPNL